MLVIFHFWSSFIFIISQTHSFEVRYNLLCIIWMRYSTWPSAGTGIITRSELKYFYTAFMDVGKLGEDHLDEITNNALEAMTSVNTQYIHTPYRKKRFQDFKHRILPKIYMVQHLIFRTVTSNWATTLLSCAFWTSSWVNSRMVLASTYLGPLHPSLQLACFQSTIQPWMQQMKTLKLSGDNKWLQELSIVETFSN